jgi:hypothetical protein
MPFGISKKKKEVDTSFQAPDGPGQVPRPNPGEYATDGEARNQPKASLGALSMPYQGNRAGGNPHTPDQEGFLDDGARVGYLRNLEFSAGGRSQILSTNTASPQRPNISARTGQVQVSSATEGEMTAGKLGQTPATAGSHPTDPGVAQPKNTTTAGENLDTAGSAGPERRTDRRGV